MVPHRSGDVGHSQCGVSRGLSMASRGLLMSKTPAMCRCCCPMTNSVVCCGCLGVGGMLHVCCMVVMSKKVVSCLFAQSHVCCLASCCVL